MVILLEIGGLCHFGTVCTSFCWINSSTHQRSIAFPFGAPHSYVLLGNKLLGITAARIICIEMHLISLHAHAHIADWMHETKVALALLAWYKGSMWVLEQPRGSILKEHPAFQQLLHIYTSSLMRTQLCGGPILCHSLSLGDYGALSHKPITLYSPEAMELQAPSSSQPASSVALATTYIDQHGHRRCTGTTALKQSQEYPELCLGF